MTKEQAIEILTQEVVRQACKDLYALRNKNLNIKTRKDYEEELYIEEWLYDLGLWSLVCAIDDGKKPIQHEKDIKPIDLPSTNETVIQNRIRAVNDPLKFAIRYKNASERRYI